MPVRSANAVWEGDLKSGKGVMKFSSGAFQGAYSFSSRFEEGTGTNPEELIAAAHAGCFSMAFSNGLAKAGMLWVAWPKKRSGVLTDLTFDVVQRAGLDHGLVDTKICAIDDTWSGLKFVIPKDQRAKRLK